MSDLESSRRKLWSFVISAIGAVGIMLHLESFENLSITEASTRLVMTNFVVMTLGGLGSGLLGLAITADPDKEDAAKFQKALYSVLERIYIFVVLSSLAMFALAHVLSCLGAVFVTDRQFDGMVITFWSALVGVLLSAYRLKSARLDEWVGVFLFLLLLVILAIYANALIAVWTQAVSWFLALNVLVVFLVMILSRYYRNKSQPIPASKIS
ncbi:hypothetical protein [Pseudomonas costantinii]|uniref:hypothetical protein n=1 Tax=Pseudomonas costantinii TaxID=168469 RepID=UPI0015A2D0EC|nr:hypothetical protein [Pseudomonas costantinii]NVZ72113.1 hypothetical protein [Pseudomonas costantinii]